MEEREADLAFLSEVWEKQENLKHQAKLEKMLEIRGIQYISTPRPGQKRGGGAAIAIRTKNFNIKKLNIPIPKSVEVVWGLLKPKTVTGRINKIISCCFYSPPKSRLVNQLVDHITTTLQHLLVSHQNAGIIISGDKNEVDTFKFLQIDPSLRQTVQHPTRGQSILDVVYTNLSRYFSEPTIIPPICPDNPAKGVPSDHMGIIVKPRLNPNQTKQKTRIRIRPLPSSLIDVFGLDLAQLQYNFSHDMNSTQLVETFQNQLSDLVKKTFPERTITVHPEDKPYFTEKLRGLKRKRMREYEKNGKSEKYLKLKETFEIHLEIELEKYKEKINIEVTEGKRGSIYPALKKLGLRPGSEKQGWFHLPSHDELDPAQSAEVIAEHFCQISQEFSPLSILDLPPNIQKYLSDINIENAQILNADQISARIKHAKKPISQVPGDLPPKLVKEFPDLLALPLTVIFNKITTSSVYPGQWKVEHQVPIPKVDIPESEDQLRNIAKTAFFSKVYESFVAEWLMKVIKPYFDPGQCGVKGLSTTHYLIKFLDFIHRNLDKKNPHAVLAAFVDLKKAFNRVQHSLVIQDLYDMHTPDWLLRILFSYLSDRSMFLSYNGATSSRKLLPGGTPQGAILGGLIFMVKFNGAFLRPPIPRLRLANPQSESTTVKFVDDGSIGVSINLKTLLVPETQYRPKPLTYNERTGHILPQEYNLLQNYISDAESYFTENKMMINMPKTNVMLFNRSRNWSFPPEISFQDGTALNCISETKLVGIIITDDLKWQKNTDYICQKARKKIWLLRRMKSLKLSAKQMLDVYQKEIRSIVEMAVPVWHSGLTKKQSRSIERIQKISFRIILDTKYQTYNNALVLLESETLEQRRRNLCKKFALKNLKSEYSFFTPHTQTIHTRSKKKVKEFNCNSATYSKSSLPFLAKLVNSS